MNSFSVKSLPEDVTGYALHIKWTDVLRTSVNMETSIEAPKIWRLITRSEKTPRKTEWLVVQARMTV
jgi:hypothetical protein